jgi:hypothetical protein
MSKLQPNFSWQKYVGKPQDEKDQFQFQLQRQFILIANSVNSTIDDLSYFLRPRATSWAWVNGSQIYKVTLATTTWASGGTVNIIPIPVTGDFQVIYIQGTLSNGSLASSNTVSLPYLDPVTGANSIGIIRNGTNIQIVTGGTDYSAYSGYVTIYYILT